MECAFAGLFILLMGFIDPDANSLSPPRGNSDTVYELISFLVAHNNACLLFHDIVSHHLYMCGLLVCMQMHDCACMQSADHAEEGRGKPPPFQYTQ